jgi:hypothetical protein
VHTDGQENVYFRLHVFSSYFIYLNDYFVAFSANPIFSNDEAELVAFAPDSRFISALARATTSSTNT